MDKLTIEEIAKGEQFRITVDALLPTYSKRPDIWYELIAKLINDGFTFDHTRAEWQNGAITGRVCFHGSKNAAWLRHRDNTQSHHVGERLDVNPDIELRGRGDRDTRPSNEHL